MKPFAQWTKEEVENEFKLIADTDYSKLHQWLSAPSIISTEESQLLDQLAQKLLKHVYDWNEEELKVYFIALLLNIVDFHQDAYRPFLERELSVEYAEGKTLWGIVDFLVASGKQQPKQPFLFLHEYKRQINTSNDPMGQLLAAMVAAQKANDYTHPIYGAYIIGRHWYFVLLDHNIYAESLAYDATKAEIIDVVRILRNTKQLIEDIISS
ncbi:hypothetical protein TI05_13715 [Achromatium sp. WMS3]|nr:hypothetical protein TI05_13715 [Achromatium sp. WMS3]